MDGIDERLITIFLQRELEASWREIHKFQVFDGSPESFILQRWKKFITKAARCKIAWEDEQAKARLDLLPACSEQAKR